MGKWVRSWMDGEQRVGRERRGAPRGVKEEVAGGEEDVGDVAVVEGK